MSVSQSPTYKDTSSTATRFLWQLGGADVELLPRCPVHERTKFVVGGLIVMLLTIGVAFLTGLYVYRWAGKVFEDIMLASSASGFSGILAGILTATILTTGMRVVPTLQVDRHLPQAMRIVTLYRRMIALLAPATIVGLWTAYVLQQIQPTAGTDVFPVDVYVSVFSIGIMMVPAIVAATWPSPIYSAKIAEANRGYSADGSDGERAYSDVVSSELSDDDSARDSQIETLESLLAESPENVETALYLIDQLEKADRIPRAIEVFDQLITSDPENTDYIQRQSELLLNVGDRRRYNSNQQLIEQIQSRASFEENLQRRIAIDSLETKS
ncbi:MAG: hypothetical protein AAF417_23485, partial [Pseudomonadota bacterium]